MDANNQVSAAGRAQLDHLVNRTSLRDEIVSIKIWSPQGEIIYSPVPRLMGDTFEVDEHLQQALAGVVVSGISELTDPENAYERSQWDMLIETYAPIRSEGTGAVIAVMEFYQLPDTLAAGVRQAAWRSWAIVGFATFVMYLLLVGMARRVSRTVRAQQSELKKNVDEMRHTLDENQQLQGRANRAAARTTTLNEQFLRRISADIHDGPAQDLSFAVLRIGNIADTMEGSDAAARDEVATQSVALESALTNLRAITQGLRTPNVENMAPCDAARQAVADFARISGESVKVVCDDALSHASMPVNITIYRVVQEPPANSYKYAGAASREVRIKTSGGLVEVEIKDNGVGFDAGDGPGDAKLGHMGMKERVELLGSSFAVESARGAGTTVRARLPLSAVGADV